MVDVSLIAPDTWQGYTAILREGPNYDWVPFNDGVFVGSDTSLLQTMYESGDQEDVEEVSEYQFFAAFSRTMWADTQETSYPPTWNGSSTVAGARVSMLHATANADLNSTVSNQLAVYKATYHVSVPEFANVTGVYLRFLPSQIGGSLNPDDPLNFVTTWASPSIELGPGSVTNMTGPRSHYCASTDTLTSWTANYFDWTLEPARLETWSAEWTGNHSATDSGDFKAGTAGTAISEMSVVVEDLYTNYGDSEGFVKMPLSNWESQIAAGDVSLIFSLDDTPITEPQNLYQQIGLGVYNSHEYNAAAIACGSSPPAVTMLHNRSGTAGGVNFGGAPQLIVEVEPFFPVGEKPLHMVEREERGIVYFDLTELPDAEPISVTFQAWGVYAWSSEDGSTAYLVPIDPTNPSQEGPMPIEIERHHPAGLIDKSGRAVWSEAINDLEYMGPTLLEVPLAPTILDGLEQIGFQFGINPASTDPFTYSYLYLFNELSSGSPHSPYTGPRLLIVYEIDGEEVIVEIAVSATIPLRGLEVSGRARVVPYDESSGGFFERHILTHKARQHRGW